MENPLDQPPKAGTPTFESSENRRWKKVDKTMRLHGFSPDALIETLHTVQETFGFLDDESLKYVAKSLHVPLSRVYAVATFYHFFKLKPPGRHTCVVCMGTACYISGAADILRNIEQTFGIKPGETTPDGSISLMTARCFGSCGLAPAAIFDGEVIGKLTASDVVKRLERWNDNDT